MLLQVLWRAMTGFGQRRAALRAMLASAVLVPVLALAVLPLLATPPPAAAQDTSTVPPASAPADPTATTVVPPDPGTTVAPVPAVTQPGTATSAGPAGAVEPGNVAGADLAAPDLLVTVGPGADPASTVDALTAALAGAPGVAWAAGDAGVQPAQVLVGLEPGNPGDAIDEVRRIVAAQPAAAQLTVAGRALSDDAVAGRARLGAIVATLLAMVLVGGLMAWLRGRNEAAVAVAGIGVTTLLGGALAAAMAGPFDGSVATTALPGVLAALLMATYLLLRLIGWFTAPQGDDHPSMVQAAWRAVGTEAGLSLAGLAVVAVLIELVSPARAVVSLVLVGAVVATVVILPVAPPLLALLHHPGGAAADETAADDDETAADDDETAADAADDADGADRAEASPVARPEPEPLWLTPAGPALPGPDGRQLPVAVLVAAGIVLALLAVFSFRSTSPDALFDERATATELDPAVLTTSGDPTAAIVARFDPGIDQLAKSAWLERISLVPGVARVETATGRYVAGTRADVPTVPLAAAGIDRGDETPELALIVPTVSSRSPAAQELVGDVRQMSGTVAVHLSGAPVDARTASGRDASSAWVLIIFLSVAAAATTFALVRDLRLAAASGGLRLLGSAATAGFYQLLTSNPTGAEIQVAVLVGALATSLFELGVLRRLRQGPHTEATDDLLDDALRTEGWPALAALLVTSVAGLGLLVADLTVVRRLAVVLVITAIVESMAGMWLLRPPVVGDRALRFLAVHPVEAALKTVLAPATPDDQRWTRVVTDLLAAEQALQTDPAGGDLDRVFVPGTPLHRKATDHHAHLAEAGLRVLGRDPQLRMVRVVGTSPTVTLTVTVDHPPRQLVDAAGSVLGVRKPERRSVMLWLQPEPGGSHRIADSVELGVEPLGAVDEAPAASPAAAPGLLVDPATR